MQHLSLVALVVRNYDEAIRSYAARLGFDLMEDTFIPEQEKRWVVIEPRRVGEPVCSWRVL